MILNLEHLPRVIPVGIQTESGVEAIGFDLSPWMTRWPDLTFAVWPTRPGESASYIAADTELVGNVLYWYPNAADTEKEGAGTVEVVGIGSGKCKSSGVIDTLVKKTSLDVTQETPEPMKLWADKVLQAANEVKASVDAGQGGLYIVNVERRGELQTRYADRSQEEIREAVANHKTCVLVDADGRVCVYIGEKEYPHDPYPVCPTFVAPLEYKQWHGFTYWQMQVLPSGKIAEPGYKPAKTPNPYKLAVKQGDTTVKYDGSEEVNLEIPEGIPDPGKAFQQLVSDKDGKAVWEERLAWKEVTKGVVDILKEETLPIAKDDNGDGKNDMFATTTPIPSVFEDGKTYEVTLNGTVYNTAARHVVENNVTSAVMLGNTFYFDGENGEDTGEPFLLAVYNPEMLEMSGGMSLMCVVPDGADSVTLSIRGEAIITDVKKIDPEYLPDTHKTITIMIDADGNVTSDTPFAEAWSMTPGELQAAIVIRETSNYKGTTYTAADNVSKAEGGFVPSMYGGRMINIRVRKALIDVSDLADKDTTRCLAWAEGGFGIATEMSYAMPILPVGQQSYVGRYARYNGSTWDSVTIDQLKADLGLGGEDTTTDVFYTADGEVFTDLNGAVMHVQKGEA